MASCGDMFLPEVVTVDGYTPRNPYGMVAIPSDFYGWRALMQRTLERLQAHWAQLGELEPSPFEFWNANVERKNELVDEVDELSFEPSATASGIFIAGAIDDCIEVILDMNCFREQVVNRLVELGAEPENLPDAGTAAPAGNLATNLMVGALVVGAIVVGVKYIGPALARR